MNEILLLIIGYLLFTRFKSQEDELRRLRDFEKQVLKDLYQYRVVDHLSKSVSNQESITMKDSRLGNENRITKGTSQEGNNFVFNFESK